MRRNHIVEKEWMTKGGLKAVCIRVTLGHLCGYIGLEKSNKLYGLSYSDDMPDGDWDQLKNTAIGKRGPIDLLHSAAAMQEGRQPEIGAFFDVHGSITYMETKNNYPIKTDDELTWVGFDCAHYNDLSDPKDLRYVIKECESLSKQLVKYQKETK